MSTHALADGLPGGDQDLANTTDTDAGASVNPYHVLTGGVMGAGIDLPGFAPGAR